MKTVAQVSFHDNHSISMDVVGVETIAFGRPMRLDESQWFCEVVVHTVNGKVALQLLADDPRRFRPDFAEGGEDEGPESGA